MGKSWPRMSMKEEKKNMKILKRPDGDGKCTNGLQNYIFQYCSS